MILRRISASLVLAGLALVAAASPAMAHTDLDSSDPANGASLVSAPKQVQLKFAEAVTLPADPIQVTGPDGAKWKVGKATTAGPVVTAPVEATGPAGAYVLNYTVLADDGDEVKGAVHFTLTTAATTSSAAPSSSAQPVTTPATPAAAASDSATSSGFPVWAWIVIAVVVVAAIAGLLAVRSRRSSD